MDSMPPVTPSPTPSANGSRTAIWVVGVIILVLVVVLVWWFASQNGSKTNQMSSNAPVEHVDAVNVEQVQALSPLFGKVTSVDGTILTVEEINRPMPGQTDANTPSQATSSYKIQIATSTAVSDMITQKSATVKDIKTGYYVLTSGIDRSATQPIEVTSLQFNDKNPY